jgi:hypothetical protein
MTRSIHIDTAEAAHAPESCRWSRGGVVTYAVGGRQYVAAASGSPSNFWIETPRFDLDPSGGKGVGAPTVVVFTLAR